MPRPEPRLRLLVTEDRVHADEHWTRQMPRLLGPLGVEAARVPSGTAALDAASRMRFDIAVIDLATPAGGSGPLRPPASGLWLLEVLRRMEGAPATVVINAAAGPRQAERLLLASLRLGASAVIPRPVELNTLLEAIRRVLRRGHQDRWPGDAATRPPAA
ncbi:hypothetical protein PSMK_31920 [Phycisphaera mikurensis NBRC 102666]|uniref:Response regulatory domain-containing protein n=1 Tax=Phycisphaera mikurensis (strain NBRC 102666 / KCTC 22515 / FYK2301M01) TaxID=1142394 RepID=I0IJB3_PHYMF|nr:hypothetical protein PSMK_31920 [Phycisphaera mikurensis NBRC 102666]